MGLNDSILNFVDGRLGTGGRYIAVSAVNVVNHQILLRVANGMWGWPGGLANAFAATVALFPAYLLTRSWVWSVSGSHSVRREVVPFFILALLGLVVSSATSEMAERMFGAGLWVNVGSLIGYVGVWVLKFFILERIFAGQQFVIEPADAEPEPVRAK
jgi:putative flippase GtrA